MIAKLTNFNIWLHGLAAVFISTFSTSAMGLIMLPDVFSFTKVGMLNMAKMSALPALVSVFAYLKTSPVPALSVTTTTTATETVEVKKG